MKKLIYVLPLAFTMMACGEGSSDDLSLDQNSGIEDIDNAVHSFADGEAGTAQQYFSGLVAEVVKVDVKFREVEAEFCEIFDGRVDTKKLQGCPRRRSSGSGLDNRVFDCES